MAHAQVKPQTTVSLEFNFSVEEARTLMEMMQNPLHGRTPEEESPTEFGVRECIFKVLHNHFYGSIPDCYLQEKVAHL